MKFAIGDKVIEKAYIYTHTSYPVQQVVGVLDDALLLTPWGDGFAGELHYHTYLDEYKVGSRVWRESVQRYTEDELFTPEEALTELRRLEAAEDNLEQQFELVQEQVRILLAQGTQYVEEAAALVAKHKKTFEDVVNDCIPLYKALKQGGWRHSTLKCKVG